MFILSLLSGGARLFTNKSTLPFMIGGIILAAVIGAGVWGWSTIADLKRDKIEQTLRTENKDLQETVAEHNAMIQRMVAAQADFESRVGAIAGEMETLNRNMARNVVRRQQSYDSLVVPQVPGQTANSRELQDRANAGMTTFFGDLETLSRENLNEQK